MQFDKDLNSPHAQLFLDVRQWILRQIGEDAQEKYSDNITSFVNPLGGFCYLKTTAEGVHIGWFRGVNFEDSYGVLGGKGKTIRGQTLTTLTIESQEIITNFIEQTRLFLIEHKEQLKLKRGT